MNTTPLRLVADAIRRSRNSYKLSYPTDTTSNTLYLCPKCEEDNMLVNLLCGKLCCVDCDYCTTKDKYISKKDFNLIKRVIRYKEHYSALEQSLLTFDIELSIMALLEWVRNGIDVPYILTNSSYLLTLIGINENINIVIKDHIVELNNLLTNSNKEDLDKMFMCEMQVSFNLRNFISFLERNTSKLDYKEVRDIGIEILNTLKEKEPMYFDLLMENESINDSYMSETVDLESYRRPVVKLVRK